MIEMKAKNYWIGTIVLLAIMAVFSLIIIFNSEAGIFYYAIVLLLPLSVIGIVLTLAKNRNAHYFNLVMGICYLLLMLFTTIIAMIGLTMLLAPEDGSIPETPASVAIGIVFYLAILLPFVLFPVFSWRTKTILLGEASTLGKKYCSNCGSMIAKEAKFCPDCGAKNA